MGVSGDFSELRDLAADLSKAGPEAAERAKVVVRKTALDVEASAKVYAPVDTGFLRTSIGNTVTIGGDVIEAEVGPTAEYGLYVELGTSRMAPQPYLAPAFDRVEPGFVAAMEQIGGEIL